MARILVDTSAVFALLDRSDVNHAAARDTLQGLKRRRTDPLLTNFIVAESHALVLSRLGADLARRWLLGNAWPVERVTEDDEARARAIIARFTDKTFSYTDATSFAVMERLGLKTAFAFDPHFRQYGFQLLGTSTD
ncbi:MAG: PIN domain-containing protein [Acidobacteria bacterium]|nr:PIN domain-containing protein [Acidobacteriota bacterium]